MNQYLAPEEHTGGKKVLAEKLAVLLADVASYKAVAHGYHWNVKGPEFTQFHDFFAELYEDAESAIDPTAENIRKLGYDAPFTLADFISLSCLEVAPVGSDPMSMSKSLYQINQHIKACTVGAFNIANDINEQGIANFLAERIDMHDKWLWQLGTTIGADSTSITVIEF
jgi:starvation-inducible DNA-binding protein